MEERIKNKVKQALIIANTKINPEVKPFIDQYEGPFSQTIRENCAISAAQGLPLCQDTGMVEFFCYLGMSFPLNRPLQEILDEAVSQVYSSMPYRYSTVDDPLFERKNRLNNTPCIVHLFQHSGDDLKIDFLIKGGGSENLSRLYMMSPSSTKEEIAQRVISHIKEAGARACPPLKIGIGLGGTSEKAMLLSKLALASSISSQNEDERYRLLEARIKDEINKLSIGFQGLKKGLSCYSVHILTHPTHIATLPLAVCVDCYLCRTGSVHFEA